jgi:NAD(P)-dependent dehydrogenase (short-subunit alcohol dehydrogenase family)
MSQPSAIVTGASRGIGAAITRALAEDGWALTISSRRADAVEQVGAELRDAGATVEVLAGNLAEEDDIRAIVAAHETRFDRLDLLVNNGGMGFVGPADNYRTDRWDLQYQVNLRAIAIFYRECLDLLKKTAAAQGSATVINLSSISGKRGEGGLAMYSAVKAGVIGFTQAMNQELLPFNVRSCAMCPAFVDTSLSDYAKHEMGGEAMIRPDDIAKATRFVVGLSPHCVVPEIIFENDDVVPFLGSESRPIAGRE